MAIELDMIRDIVREMLTEMMADKQPPPPAAPVLVGAAQNANGLQVPDPATQDVGEAGTRESDTFYWRHTTGGVVAIGAGMVSYKGIVAAYAGGNVTISGTKYVYGEIAFTRAANGVITAANTLTLATDAAYQAGPVLDGTELKLRIPLYKMKLLSNADEVVCELDYVHGVPDATLDKWTADSDADAAITHKSLQRIGNTDKTLPDVVQLYDFDDATPQAMIDGASGSWPSGGTPRTEHVLLRSLEGGVLYLRYAIINPMPAGDSTSLTAKWNDTKKAFEKATLVDDANNETATTPLASGARVVVGMEHSPNAGHLGRLITQPLGTFGGSLTGYTETSVPVAWQWNSSSKKWEWKKATVLVKDGSTDAAFSDAGIPFAAFST